MSTVLRVQAILQATSLQPEDASINVWHFQHLSGDRGDAVTEIKERLDTFYASIAAIYNENTTTGVITYKTYDLVDPEPRAPIDVHQFAAHTLDDADALPTECAIVMSFQGEITSGLNQRRRRGRLYLGPLSIGPASTTSGYVRVGATTLDDLQTAANVLLAANDLQVRWCVFSPTTAGTPPWTETELGLASVAVHDGWFDDAFDTQRRRGTIANFRVPFDGTV